MALLSMTTAKHLRFNWSAWHRRLGLVTCIGVVLWGLSGMSHPIMSRLQPKPAAFTAPSTPLELAARMEPGQALACAGISQFQRLNIINIDDVAMYRVVVNTDLPASYFSANDCRELPAGDEYYARQLASHYTGRPVSEIVRATFITQFDDEYLDVNRLLPVWRIEFAGSGSLRAFIDTDQARLATLIDDTRMVLGSIFRFGHNWAFLDKLPRLQLGIMAVVLGVALFSAISGLTLYVRRRRHSRERMTNQPVRRWHRRLGLLVALSTFMFVGSGAFHLIMSYSQRSASVSHPLPMIQASTLSMDNWQQVIDQPAHRIDLVQSSAGLQWLLRNDMPPARIAAMHHAEHHAAPHALPATLLPASDGEQSPLDMLALARNQAAGYAGLPEQDIVQSELVTQFGGEYGFIFKRLPVVKVQFSGPGNPRFYIEPSTGALSAKVEDIDATEGWTFAYLHKWNFLDFNKDVRDALVMLFALGNVLVALMGAVLFYRQSK